MKRPGQPRRTPLARRKSASPSRSSLPARSSGIRRTPVKRRNAKRQAKSFAMNYHSKARVAWVQSLPCLVCIAIHPALALGTAGRSQNAHTVTAGAGLKAGYETIVPLCASHHRRYDEHRAPLDTPRARAELIAAAAKIEAMWQAFSSLTSKAGQHG